MSSILYFDELNSTNLYVKENRDTLQSGTLVVAHAQTNGKGRGNHTWASSKGGFYGSFLIKDQLSQPATLPLFIAVIAVQAVQAVTGAVPQTKWPNDLLLNSKKISGILCESLHQNYVCGIGINLAQPQSYFAQQNLPYATSLLAETGQTVTVEEMATALYKQFAKELPLYQKKGLAPFLQAYKQNSFTIGKTAIYNENDANISNSKANTAKANTAKANTAKAVDVKEDGGLVIQTENGDIKTIYSGEVTIKGLYGQV